MITQYHLAIIYLFIYENRLYAWQLCQTCNMGRDQSLMYCRRDWASFINDEFIKRVEEFIAFAYSQNGIVNGDSTRCPCRRCENSRFQIADTTGGHLYYNECMVGYTTQTSHGEYEIGQSSRYGDKHVDTMS